MLASAVSSFTPSSHSLPLETVVLLPLWVGWAFRILTCTPGHSFLSQSSPLLLIYFCGQPLKQTGSGLARKMEVIQENRGIAIWDVQTMVNHRQVQETKEGTMVLQRKGKSWEGQFWTTVYWKSVRVLSCGGFLLAELLLGKEKLFLLPAWVCKVIYNEWICIRTLPSCLPSPLWMRLSFIHVHTVYTIQMTTFY